MWSLYRFGFLTVVLGGAAAHAQPVPEAIDARTFYLPLVQREAALRDLPAEIADAVAMVETGYRPDAVGSSGEIGLMQVMPATAAQLGFHGTLAELADPVTNVRLGVSYLARAWVAGGGDICRALTKYRAGLGQELITPLSAQYCARAVAWLTDRGSRLPETGLAAGGVARAAPDPFVVAMLPALPEQAGLLPTPAMALQAVPRDPYQQTIAPRPSPGRRSAARYERFLPQVQASLARLDESR